MQSAVEFPTPTRVHVALDASDVERSIAFYRTLFGQEPTKVRPGYAKFEIFDPPVNLTLNRAEQARPSANHFGVQVKSSEAVAAMKEKFENSGLETLTEDNVTCCYSVQDKVWVKDPDGNPWEVFVVLDADAPAHGKTELSEACCAPTAPTLVSLG